MLAGPAQQISAGLGDNKRRVFRVFRQIRDLRNHQP
jgi:hypothetical protein